jgi:hypothetical protein
METIVLRLAEAHRVMPGSDGGDRRLLEPVWAILEDESDCLLVDARHVKQVPSQDRCFRRRLVDG